MSEKPARKTRARKPKPAPDFAILGGPTEDGQGTHLVRFRDGEISAGEIRPVKEGEPITHRELVRLHPLEGDKRVVRVETLHAPPQQQAPQARDEVPRSRPARVSNERYRKNYDAIFDSKRSGKKRDWDLN
jgi:hypothetical protein